MPYTRPWEDVNFLLGARYAHEIDDASRETHVDLTERFSDILEDVEADPWVINKVSLLGPSIIRYSWSVGYVKVVEGQISIAPNFNYVYPTAGAGPNPGHIQVIMPVPVPVGYRLKWIAVRTRETADVAAVASATLYKSFPDGLPGVIASAPASVGTNWENRVIEGAPVEEILDSLVAFYVVVDLQSGSSNTCYFQDMEVSAEPT